MSDQLDTKVSDQLDTKAIRDGLAPSMSGVRPFTVGVAARDVVALCDEVDALRALLAESQAQVAALKKAFEVLAEACINEESLHGKDDYDTATGECPEDDTCECPLPALINRTLIDTRPADDSALIQALAKAAEEGGDATHNTWLIALTEGAEPGYPIHAALREFARRVLKGVLWPESAVESAIDAVLRGEKP